MKNAALFIAAVLAAPVLATRADDKVDFAKSIQPILEKRCIECHGPKKQKGDLRLDSKDAALKGGKDAKAIVPEKLSDSDMVRRISLPPGDDDIMPPKGDPLTKDQIELIKKWISEGAEWPQGLVLGGESEKKEEGKPSGTGKATASSKKQKAPGQEFANLTPTKDTAAEQEAIKKLGVLGISVRPIAQNLQWKEATVRPQDTNKTSEAIALLKDIPSLVDLNLAKLNLKDDDLKSISSLSNLQRLHLENNPVTDAGLANLKGLTNLEYLNLYNTQVGDAGIENLKGMKNLMALYLWQSKVTDDGAAKLKKELPEAMINRGEELKLMAKVEEKKEEKKDGKSDEKKDEAKKEKKDEKAEPKKEEKKEDKAAEAKKEDNDSKKEEKKSDDKKSDEKKPDEKKADEAKKADEKKAGQ
ncbi:MAG TPA: c-type cytochrome domain-containing protein [Verrucomicrobiae bacterium]|nr:c-type cytochrome domain-containing protein [Verrucomicrobiae bacterium]